MIVTPELLVAVTGLVGALTILVVQTGRLISVSERYMIELRRANAANETLWGISLQKQGEKPR